MLQKLQSNNETMNLRQSTRLGAIENAIQGVARRFVATPSPQQTKAFSPADITTLEDQMSLLSMKSSNIMKEHMVLSSLNFDSRLSRYDLIKDAHQQSFDWVFQGAYDPNVGSTTGRIFRWLKHGEGIFWISGKPGSGKSTLMKYILNHRETLPTLMAWSHPQPTVMASHFFWGAGSSMQKSRKGLLQTLLFEIFRQQPNLIETACPERWSLKNPETFYFGTWLIPELARAIDRIVECKNLSVKFCFFIDGLDEFEDDHVEFCQALRKLSTSAYVKLCVSSRPWNVFEDLFGKDISSKLYIHELTQDDIFNYVKDSLESHYRWPQLGVEAEYANSLICQVVTRAAGVFLWVFFVVRELRSGLTEYDTIVNLHRRLETIPTDLGAFFKQILESVDKVYHTQMAKLLKAAIALRRPESIDIYGFLSMEFEEDEDYVLKRRIDPETLNKKMLRRLTVCQRLSARCRGILEVNSGRTHVDFLHRSVIEFLKTPEMTVYLNGKIWNTFDANLSLLKAFIACIKSISLKGPRFFTILADLSKKAIVIAQGLNNTKAYELLAHLDFCTLEMYKRLPDETQQSIGPLRQFLVRRLILTATFVEYFDYILPIIPGYLCNLGERASVTIVGLLHESIRAGKKEDYLRYKDLFQHLFERHYSPSELEKVDVDSSPWERIFRILIFERRVDRIYGDTFSLISLMLNNGEDPNFKVQDVVAWIRFAETIHLCIVYVHDPKLQPTNQILDVLDNFKAACAVNLSSLEGVPGDLVPGINLAKFFDDLPLDNSDNHYFFAQVTERLLLLAKMHQHDISQYFKAIEKTFPPLIVKELRTRCLGSDINDSVELPTSDNSQLNRKRKNIQEEGLIYKRRRSL